MIAVPEVVRSVSRDYSNTGLANGVPRSSAVSAVISIYNAGSKYISALSPFSAYYNVLPDITSAQSKYKYPKVSEALRITASRLGVIPSLGCVGSSTLPSTIARVTSTDPNGASIAWIKRGVERQPFWQVISTGALMYPGWSTTSMVKLGS